jgi:CopG family nickel-responsive transcriptional regulator
LDRFDRSIHQRGYTNRSEAFRDLIRDRLVAERTAVPDAAVVGTVTLVYDHHAHGITEKLTEVQHAHHELIVSGTHTHLDRESCLEVLIVRGRAAQVERLADRLIGLKGVQHGRLVLTVPEKALDRPHEIGSHESGLHENALYKNGQGHVHA